MSDERQTPRLDYIDVERFAELERYLTEGIESRKWAHAKFPQLNYRKIGGDSYVVGCLRYALGRPLDDVAQALRECAAAYLQVFMLRGTEPAFPVKKAITGRTRHSTGGEDLSQLPDARSSLAADFSLTNSKDGLQAVYSAWAVQDDDTGDKLASMLHDPLEATYVGRLSQVCTEDEQRLAYAIRDYLCGKLVTARQYLDALTRVSAVAPGIQLQAVILDRLLSKNSAEVKERLGDYLDWFGKEACAKVNHDDPDFFLCTPALGIASLALRAGCLSIGHNTFSSIYFPFGLLG